MKLKVSEIKVNPNNPRTIKDDNFKKLVQSIKDFPEMTEVREVVVNKDYVILGGNMRFQAMKAAGVKEIPVKIVDWSEEKQREFIIKDNVSGGDWDWDILANEWDTEQLDEWGLELPANLSEDQEVEEDEAPEVDETEPPKSELGKIYQLGRHRVMCGDSTDKASVELLMDGEKADMVFTDPPYGIDIKGKFTGKIKNDELVGDALQDFLKKAFDLLKEFNKGSSYICYEVLNQKEFNDAFGSKPDEIIVWVKDSASFYSDNKYNRRFEAIAYYENDNKLKAKAETNVWEFAKSSSFNSRDENGLRFNEAGNYLVAHPTTKPVGLVSRAINNSSDQDHIVLDLFLGSGSTLIACEQTDRTCYGMELDPKYVDVIRKRYHKFVTGDEEGWEDGTPAIN